MIVRNVKLVFVANALILFCGVVTSLLSAAARRLGGQSVPRLGIVGAAVASLLGYSMTMFIGLFWLLRKTKLGVWSYLRPRREDIPVAQLRTLLTLEPLRTRNLET